jgi:hypothetical protein
MANLPPNTEQEAELKCIFIPNIMEMHIERFGKGITNPPKCSELGPGLICESYLSSDGKSRFVIYCDQTGNCLRRYECPA